MKADQLALCRSDAGDGGWSLHAPGSTDEQIASGEASAILSGESAKGENGEWLRPNEGDYENAAWLLALRSMVDPRGLK
jgi:hypothetical protein